MEDDGFAEIVRFAGRKAVIVRSFDEGTRDRPYGHCLVAGIAKYPKKVIRKDSAKKTAKKSRVKAFIKDIVTLEALQSRDKKVTASKATKARFEERLRRGRTGGSFTKLRSASWFAYGNRLVPGPEIEPNTVHVVAPSSSCFLISSYCVVVDPVTNHPFRFLSIVFHSRICLCET
ncbi:hypothetical protein HPP92_023557 [Vanilla planifolia]|uniref:60S ribosomal protein L27 n=1 Tax=Vanilla planifolia TaxID=51239 RepID=A0A835UAI2_VANPL|nr:hypothetical protein HPP92_023557 [Vanilla planifolia]